MLLQTFGCSFTYGEELPDPSTQSWPVLLANKLNYNLDNCGSPGVGNDYIIKTAIKRTPKLNPNLVIVSWTSCGRMEFADENDVYDIWPGCNRRFKVFRPHRNTLIKYITSYNNQLHQYRCWLRNVILLQDFFKLRNIDYRFVSTFDNLKLHAIYGKHSNEYLQHIDTDKFIGWPDSEVIDWVYGYEHGTGGHPLELAHQRIADVIFDAL